MEVVLGILIGLVIAFVVTAIIAGGRNRKPDPHLDWRDKRDGTGLD